MSKKIFTRIALAFMLFLSVASFNVKGQAIITTDKPDYAPRSNAVFTGSGFAPNESVVLKVKNLFRACNTVTADSSYLPWTVKADSTGSFVTNWTVCDCAGDSLRLKATGQTSGLIAYVLFSDAATYTTSIILPSSAICQGASANYKIRIVSNSAAIKSATVTIPGGVTSVSSVSCTAYKSNNSVLGAWTNQSVSGSGLLKFVTLNDGGGNSTNLGNNEYIEITFTAVANTAPINVWNTAAFSDSYTTAVNLSGSQPSVTINPLPIFTACPSDQSINITSGCSTVVNYTATSTSTLFYVFSGANPPSTASGSGSGSGAIFNKGVTTVTITATNSCGTETCTFTVTVNDATKPTLTPISDRNENAGASCSFTIPDYTGLTTAADNCTAVGSIVKTQSPVSGTVISGYNTTQSITITANDGNGNTETTNFTITLKDVTSPVLSGVPSSTTANCGNIPAPPTVTAEDNCSGINAAGVVLTETITAGSCAGNYVIHRSWKATDNAGNATTSATQDITVTDVTGPVLTGVPASTTANCSNIPAPPTVTAEDNCSGLNAAGVVLTETITAGSCAGNYVIHRSWKATDNCGNATTSATQDITVTDVTGPVLTGVPASTTANCGNIPAPPTVTAEDNCSGINAAGVVLTETITAGSCAGNYVIHRSWKATDNCGNATTSATQYITVTDVTGPILTGVPASTTANCSNIPAPPTVTAEDNCSGLNAAGVVLTETITAGSCAGNYVIHRSWKATDNCGNATTSATQDITVTDVTGPVLSGVPASITANCSNVPAPPTVTAEDNCSGLNAAGVVLTETITAGSCAGNYVIHRSWKATDKCGNATTSATQDITVTDVTGPVLSGVPSSTTANCSNIPALPTVTAEDNCSGINADGVVLTETITAGSCAGNYVIHRSWKATDKCGNATTSATQDITVTDVTGPVLSGVPASTTADCGNIPVAATVTATDNCSGISVAGVVLTETITAGSCAGNYVIHRSWKATDKCGNATTSATQDITVTDVTGPVLSGVPASTTADCGNIPVAATVTATDNCSGLNTAGVVLTETITAGSCAGNYVIHRSWKATDKCGNATTSATQDITVTDVTGPVFNACPASINLSACDANANWTEPTATDGCSGSTVTRSGPAPGSTFAPGTTTTITYTATDGCGNSTNCSFTVTRASTLGATIATNKPVLYFGYTGDQTATITVKPTGGTAPYKVSITMVDPPLVSPARPIERVGGALICNYVNAAGDEVWTPGGNTATTTGNACGSTPVSTSANINTGGNYSVNVTLLADARFIATVTDANGCTYDIPYEQAARVDAEDVRCFAGNSGNVKVTLCHRTGSAKNPCVTICVDQSAVQEHIDHGDFLGKCNTTCTPQVTNARPAHEEPLSSGVLEVKVMPNPAPTYFNVVIKGKDASPVTMRVMDIYGRVIQVNQKIGASSTLRIGDRWPSGAYFVEVIQGTERKVLKVIKTK